MLRYLTTVFGLQEIQRGFYFTGRHHNQIFPFPLVLNSGIDKTN